METLQKLETTNKISLSEIYNQSLLQSQNLGEITTRYCPDFGESNQTTQMFEQNNIKYPIRIKQALVTIVQEYNSTFTKILATTKKDQTDYQFCDGLINPVSLGVQIDMVALTPEILAKCEDPDFNSQVLINFLKANIFEIENNLAGYNLLGAMNPNFKSSLKTSLNKYREQTGRDIYILATTQNKQNSIATCEFGKDTNSVYDQKVLQQTGFDGVIGPEEFEKMYANNVQMPLLYVRCSLDTSELKQPNQPRSHSLLNNPNYVKLIRENSITPNIDYPDAKFKTNDTKEYMEPMGLGYKMTGIKDIINTDFVRILNNPKLKNSLTKDSFNPKFISFCDQRNINIQDIISGNLKLRAKLNNESYGCYGHLRLPFGQKFINQVTKEIQQRGSYIIQPELENMIVTNTLNNKAYKTIDRNFLMTDSEGVMQFVCGYRSYLDINSTEAKKNNIHGNNQTIYSNIN